MQKDSVHFPNTRRVACNQTPHQESPIKSIQCRCCTVTLESKVFLFKHINQEPSFGPNVALKEAGLKLPESDKAFTVGKCQSLGPFECQYCDFKACSQDVLNEHERQCQTKSAKQKVNGNLVLTENLRTDCHVKKQQKEAEDENRSSSPVMPVSKTECTPNPSKDLKTYKRPLQTITDYFGPSRLNVKSSVKLNDKPEFRDRTKQTLLLQKSPLDSSPNNSGVFQVTASDTIDVKRCSYGSLLSNELSCFLRPSNPEELGLQKGANYVGKRKTPECTHSSAAKKTKSDMVELQEQADQQQSSGNAEFSFEFSEGEEEESFIPANKDTESSTVYSCKHCEYTDANIDNLSAHYQNDHPYVRYNSVYIQDPSDGSAIFRCLICPVEFLTVPDLKRHCAKDHPECPNLFMMQSSDLVFKCFVCAFTTDVSEELITHYAEKHPKHKVDSYFMYCRYSVMKHKEEPSQLNNCVKAPRSEMAQRFSAKRDHTSTEDIENASSNQPATSDRACTTIYHCNSCNFSDPSAVVVRVHSQKSHPDKAITLDKIKAQATSHLIQPLIPGGSPESVTIKEKSSPHTDKSPDPYECPEKLFYCQICNYANIIAQGVVNHQTKAHSKIETSLEHVIKYTAMIHDEMKAQAEDSSSACHLPLPVIQADKEDLFFCHLCNYRSSTVSRVLQHCSTKHQAFKIDRDQVEQYTSSVLKQIKDSRLQNTAGKEVSQALLGKKDTTRKNTMKLSRVSACPPKKRRLQSKQPEDCSDTDGADGSSPPPRSKQSELKTYSCRACSFKGSSISGIVQHYRAVHPWSVKEDGSVLHLIKNNKSRTRKQQEDENEMSPSFESYQVPLEYEKSPEEVASPKRIKCPLCPAVFPSQRGLSAHCDTAHQDDAVQNVDAQKEERMKVHSRLHVFKCPYCYYVNVSRLGVLTHCHAKHGGLVARAESCHLQTARAHNFENCFKRKGSFLRLCGYMCKNCPQIYVTMNGLRKHCKKIHCETLASAVPKESRSAPKHSALAKRKLQKINSNQGSVSKASFLNKQVIRCQYCTYSSTTGLLLARHLQVCHKTESGAKAQDCHYKCVLCPTSYSKRRQLRKHYSKMHGNKAFLRYDASDELDERAAVMVPESSVSQHNTLEACNSSMTKEENTILVYKCPSCPYVNITYHGTFIHCKMKHPDLTVGANELQKDEILVAQLAGRSLSGDSNTGGYNCEKCPQILKSMEKLKLHCERKHSEAQATASRRSGEVDADEGSGQDFQESVSQSPCLKIRMPALGTSANGLKHPLGSVRTFPLSLLQDKKLPYKCCICSYTGSCRKYLYYHYKNAHKLDALTRGKLLQKYNKRKGPQARETTEPAEISHLECKMCPDVKFKSTQRLISHYSTAHLSGRILDFIVLNTPSRKSTGLYKCSLCNKQMNGIKKLCHHLDHHRESERKAKPVRAVASDIVETAPQAASIPHCWRDELPVLETVEDLAKWNVTPAQTFSVPPSPSSSSPSIPPKLEKAELASKENKLACKQCGRIFHSLKGLDSHERGHAALAAIKKQTTLSTSTFKHDLNKYVLYRAVNRLPFLCTLCPYRTTVLSLWRSHFMKKHRNVMKDLAKTDNKESVQSAKKELPNSAAKPSTPPEHNEDVQMTEESFYSEAPDVQRQLNHFNSMAQTSDASKTNAQEATSHDSSLLYCELCTFNTGHLSSMRRHYSNRHGKRMLTCKNCTFVTCSKKTLEMHNNMGHDASCQSAATHQRDICCPFCLYKTKNKNYMIDHIVLHREERVVPIEACRPKLSRYLQGIVFRCHKCTFTSGSAENLRVHMTKHDDIRPYKCRLCYFDCTQLSDLEAHLSDKHQVLRNHELVGQIHLDELEARVGRMPEEQEQPTSNMDCGTDCNSVSHESQAEDLAENEMEKACLNQNSADFKKQEQDHQERAETTFFSGAAGGHRTENTPELTAGDGNSLTSQNEEQVQPKLRDADGNSVIMSKPEEPLKHRRVSIELIEDDILRRVLLLEKGGSTVRMRRKSELDTPVEAELSVEPVATDISPKECLLFDNLANRQNIHNGTDEVSASAKTNPTQPVIIRTQGRFTFERHLLTLGPNNGQHKLSIKGISFANREEKQMKNPIKSEKVEDPFAESQCVKEEMHLVSICKEEDQLVDCEQKEDRRDETTHQGDKNPRHEKGGWTEDAPCVSKGPLTSMDGEATEETEAFSCEFCGRKLTNSAQLERHIVRHGK